MKIVLANSNPIHQHLEQQFLTKYKDAVIINQLEELTKEKLDLIKPEYIFFIHWSFIISKEIYDNFICILFHMTDLPFGRGGSPLQNLISRGIYETKISALKVTSGIDTGDIYLKKPFSLFGTAEEIFIRIGKVILGMIDEIVTERLTPLAQIGDPVVFKRRTSEESNLADLKDLGKIFDYIRMLDAEGYPNAYIETEKFKFEFSRASLKKDSIIADVRITKK